MSTSDHLVISTATGTRELSDEERELLYFGLALAGQSLSSFQEQLDASAPAPEGVHCEFVFPMMEGLIRTFRSRGSVLLTMLRAEECPACHNRPRAIVEGPGGAVCMTCGRGGEEP